MNRIIGVFTIIFGIFYTCQAAWGAGGSMTGAVLDPAGGTVPGVRVAIQNIDTHLQLSVITAEDGSFAFRELSAGRYEIRVEAPGFLSFLQTGVEIEAGQERKIEVRLELIPRNEVVTVSDEGPVLDTTATQAGVAIDSKSIAAVPVNGRSFTDLLALQPGIVPASARQPNAVVMAGVTSTPPSGDLNPGNVSVSGQRESANGFLVNGSDVEEDVNMGTAIVPTLDSIAEFRVLTNNFDAEHGNFSGGQILVATKSGSNALHGDLFDYFQNTALDARNFYSSERAQFNQNQFGGTLGGALRTDKLFFFADYQGSRMAQGVDTGLISVPSATDRTGDLGDVASSLTSKVNGQYWANVLTQRLGYTVSPGELYYTRGCASNLQCVFPGAVIPQRVWSAPATALLRYIPPPNAGVNTFSTSSAKEALQDDKGALRVDASPGWGTVSAYYFQDYDALDNPYPTGQGGANVPGFNARNAGRAQLLSLSATRIFGASMVNELHFSFMRSANDVGQPEGGVGPSLRSQGFVEGAGTPGIVPLAPAIEGIANVSLNDFTFGVDTTGLRQVNNTFQWSDAMSKVAGNHTFRFGAEAHIDRVNTNPDAQYNGSFAFQGTETGLDFADFLLGIASSYTQADSQSFYNRNHYLGAFAQDRWLLRSNLTLNYGVRWDVIPPWSEKYNQLQTLVVGQQSVVYPGAPEGLVFPGDPGIPSTLAPTRYNRFSPRVGLAYSPSGTGRTTIRAGYGIFYTAFEGLSAGIMSANPPYGYSYTSPAPPLFETPFITAASGQDTGQKFPLPFPAFGASAANPNSSVDWTQYAPITGVPSFYRGNVPTYAEHYTLSLERMTGTASTWRLAYVGAQAHHLLVIEEANPGNPALCLSLSQADEVMPGTATCGPFGESGTYITSAGQVIQGTRGPFSTAFGGVSYQKTLGNSSYNALEFTFRRTRGPFEFLAGYTYSKSMDQSSSLAEAVNPLNPRLNNAPSAFDMTHNFIASYRYEIPLARWAGRWKDVAGGWEISGITRFATGLPVTLYNNNDTSLLGTMPNGVNNNGVDTPNFVPGDLDLNTDARNGQLAFNTSLFSLPALGQVGTAARRFFYGPGIENFDVALEKSIRLAESRSLRIRMEAFNLLNHAQFYGPASVNGNISSPGFGQITSAAPPRLVQVAAKIEF